MPGAETLTRRAMLAAAAAPLLGCSPAQEVSGSLLGATAERGHLMRQPRIWPAPAVTRRVRVLVAGAGVAGLAAARALRLRGIDDIAVVDMEDSAGGNSRGATMGGMACPLGAHYLPVPGDNAREVQELLEALGLRQRIAGRWVYDERHLCHAPQERLFFNGAWQEGLLPVHGVSDATLAQYRIFSQRVLDAGAAGGFRFPLAPEPPASHRALDAITFSAWLDREGLTDSHLRWYLGHCCRDDYGAGIDVVSAWAGIHYFASRHGFQPPGEHAAEAGAVLTWPEGNGWLTQRLAQGLGERLYLARVILRIDEGKSGVEIDALNVGTQAVERWLADRCIVALPLFVAARTVQNPPALLAQRASQVRYAPWAVVNLQLREPLADRPGAPPSWDNVIYGAAGLGYVDAGHQGLDPRPRPTVLSWYVAPGESSRAALLERGWRDWHADVVRGLAVPHPDLASKIVRAEVARYGHAMAIPVPGSLGQFARGVPRTGRLAFAHGDWAGYSIFEEAFTAGHRAASTL